MKFCRKCGIVIIDDSAIFCPKCGARQITEEEKTAEVVEKQEEASLSTQSVESEELEKNVAEPEVDKAESDTDATENNADATEDSAEVTEDSSDADEAKSEAKKKHIGKMCAYCKTEITEEDEITVCSVCETALHKGCWDENEGCATFGCTGKPEGTVECQACGALMSEEQQFCAKCGAKIVRNESLPSVESAVKSLTECTNCKSAIEPGQAYCNSCGMKLANTEIAPRIDVPLVNTTTAQKKKAKKSLIAAIVSVFAIFAIIVGFGYSTKAKTKDYMEKAERFSSLCISCGSDLEDVGNAIQTYWGKYVNTYGTTVYYNGHYMTSIDSAVTCAIIDNSSTISSIKAERESIIALYEELMDISTGNDKLNEIKSSVKDVYEAFEDLYDCVINVSGNYTSYKYEFGDCDTELAEALKDLNNILK